MASRFSIGIGPAIKNLISSSPALHRCVRQVRRIGRLVTGRDRLYRYDIGPRKQQLGTVYGGWMIIPELLNANSVVCSFGVGNDISFDRAMIQRFGANVHGFDPSPDAIRFVASQIDLPSRYHFHPYGLGPIDGDADFFRPAQGAMYSLKAAAEQNDASRVSLPVKRLATILDALDIGFIDVLKMDIEGAEYVQIDSIVENAENIGQLLIEFHHRIGVAPLRETVNSVNRLRAAGFQLFHVSGTSSEFSFYRGSL
jgi:FkbM family methyltransferase